MAWRKKTWNDEVEEALGQIEIVSPTAAPAEYEYSDDEITEALGTIEIDEEVETEPALPPPVTEPPALDTRSNSDVPKKTKTSERRRAFLHLLKESFNEEELIDLCFDRGLPEGAVNRKNAREIIEYFLRHGRTSELMEYVRSERPRIDWPDIGTTERKL